MVFSSIIKRISIKEMFPINTSSRRCLFKLYRNTKRDMDWFCRRWISLLKVMLYQPWIRDWITLQQIIWPLKSFLNWPSSAWRRADRTDLACEGVQRSFGASAKITGNYQAMTSVHYRHVPRGAAHQEINDWVISESSQTRQLYTREFASFRFWACHTWYRQRIQHQADCVFVSTVHCLWRVTPSWLRKQMISQFLENIRSFGEFEGTLVYNLDEDIVCIAVLKILILVFILQWVLCILNKVPVCIFCLYN